MTKKEHPERNNYHPSETNGQEQDVDDNDDQDQDDEDEVPISALIS